MDDKNLDRRSAAWSRYWSHGVAHTLEGSFDSVYTGAIADFWRRAVLARPVSHVLDVATGNGALPAMFVEMFKPRAPSIDAIDCAIISPRLPHALEHRIAFHSSTSAEALPFEDGRFDLVASQYGFEYTDPDRSVPEIRRVMAPGARLAMVLHHNESVISAVASDDVRAYGWLLESGSLLDCTRRVLPYAAMVGSGTTPPADEAHLARQAYNLCLRQLVEIASEVATPDALVEAREICSRMVREVLESGRDAAALDGLRDYVRTIEDALLRSQELLDCALDRSGFERLIARFEALGIRTLDAGLLADQGRLLGWTLLSEG